MRTGFVGGRLAGRILGSMGDPGSNGYCDGSAYRDRSKLEAMFGPSIWQEIENRDVVDFGCGAGGEAIEMARRGARRVTGIDVLEPALVSARRAARGAGVSDRCHFTTRLEEPAELIVSLDGFEHFDDPAAVLRTMRHSITADGSVLAAFGPTWFHPLGGHLFSVFPWAHLIFTEKALIRWRAGFRNDGARRFREVDGGLNQMTIRRFRRLVEESEFQFDTFETVPIRRLRHLENPVTREFLTSVVRCRLKPRNAR